MDKKKLIYISVGIASVIALIIIITVIAVPSVSSNNVSDNSLSVNTISDNSASDNLSQSDNEDIINDSEASENNNDIVENNNLTVSESDNNISETASQNAVSSNETNDTNNTDDTNTSNEEASSSDNTDSATQNTANENNNQIQDNGQAALTENSNNTQQAVNNTATVSQPNVTAYNIRTNKYNNIINSDVTLPENPVYSLYVNKSLNTVTVFVVNELGQEIPFKAMLCSCGKSGHGTPAGTFKTTDYYEWRLMVDNTYGHYAVRFNNKILFHSVPFYQSSPDSLEWDQFNLLGSNASLGCVRMSVADVKWIYDNCKKGTKVVVYSDETNPGPLGKPQPIKIPEDSPYKNWDPTDESPINPWKTVNP